MAPRDAGPNTGLNVLFAASFVVATSVVLVPVFISRTNPSNQSLVDVGRHVGVLTVLWLVLFVVGLFRFKKSGLWLLIGFPFALYWYILPYLDFLVVVGRCIVHTGNCAFGMNPGGINPASPELWP